MTIKGIPANIEDDVRAIGKSAEYLQRLANGLRLLSLDPERPAANEATDLFEWWADVESFLKNCLPRGAELERCIAPEMPLVGVSRHRLTQAIFNLVQNAGDALRDQPRGWVRVTAERTPDGNWVRMTVRDNGSGMTPDIRARCMEPFFTSKARGISTGLGLSLVHGIVQQYGGTIDIETSPGKGTTFVLTFPLASKASPQPSPGEIRPPIRTVVSFADARLRTYASTVAKALGCEVDEANANQVGGDSIAEPAIDLSDESRGVVWVVDGEDLTPQRIRDFHTSPRPGSRRILAFGRLPDAVRELVDIELQSVERAAPSVIRRALRTTVNELSAALDDEDEAATHAVSGSTEAT